MVRLHNTLTRKTEVFTPLNEQEVKLYSCGPTVYDHAHIGNLSAYIFADTLRRVLSRSYKVHHVMNFTDVDDKTIRDSALKHPTLSPMEALEKLTRYYEVVFLEDMEAVGNDVAAFDFLRATDTIQEMQNLIRKLHDDGIAYVADDGVYFSLSEYKRTRQYGQLSHITIANEAQHRIQNDEYDKENAQDFALWKAKKGNEPSWPFELAGSNIEGRPGWHIECSAMSTHKLGQPFDIHTGGVDLIFPHHENEIAQSTAGNQPEEYATFFCHNEHMLVDGVKMSKSKGNFYTLVDILNKGYSPLAFRLMVLQSHYRNQTNFTWANMDAASNRLKHWQDVACLRWQAKDTLVNDNTYDGDEQRVELMGAIQSLNDALSNDIDTPAALRIIDDIFTSIEKWPLTDIHLEMFHSLLEVIDTQLGLQLRSATPDISIEAKKLIQERNLAREAKDWHTSDKLRDRLADMSIAVKDHQRGTTWSYIDSRSMS